jgi:hypothetical protein
VNDKFILSSVADYSTRDTDLIAVAAIRLKLIAGVTAISRLFSFTRIDRAFPLYLTPDEAIVGER